MNNKKAKKPILSLFVKIMLLLMVAVLVFYGTSYSRQRFSPRQTSAPTQEQNIQASEEPLEEKSESNSNELPNQNDQNSSDIEQNTSDDTIYYINETNPELSVLMDYFSAKNDCTAVSLVAYDGDSRNFYSYQYGNKRTRTTQSIESGDMLYGYTSVIPERAPDVDTKFCVASLSKLITVICAMTLVDEGKLDLDKDISEYLGYEVRNPGFPDTAITSRMLMQHTSTLGDTDDYWSPDGRYLPETTEGLLNNRNSWHRDLEPGTTFVYSAFLGYSVLGLVCEIVSDKRFDTLAHDVLFNPMGIDAAFLPNNLRDTSNIAVLYLPYQTQGISVQEQLDRTNSETRESDHDLTSAHLTISALDYAKILIMLGNGGLFDNVKILSKESVQEIHNANVTIEGYYKSGLSTRYQYLEHLPFEGSYWHIGGFWGVRSQYIRFIDENKNRGVVVFTTGSTTGWVNHMLDVGADLSFIAMQIFD